jgi:hypothetical protein
VDELPALGDADGVEVLDGLAAPDAREDLGLFIQAIRRDEHGDRLADRFGRRMAEELLGSRVPGGDDPLEGRAHDGVVGGLDDRRQPRRGVVRREYGAFHAMR